MASLDLLYIQLSYNNFQNHCSLLVSLHVTATALAVVIIQKGFWYFTLNLLITCIQILSVCAPIPLCLTCVCADIHSSALIYQHVL